MRIKIAALAACTALSLAACGVPTDASTNDAQAEETSSSSAPAAKKPAAKPKPAPKPAMKVSAKQLISVLEGNALKAKNTYKGKRVTASGFVGNIDASGKYFSLDPEPDAFILTGVQVQLDKKFQKQVSNFEKGQKVTVTGEITDVGEVMGYELEAEAIK